MKVLVINCGSSSLKYQLIDSVTEEVLAKGLCERIGIDGRLTHKPTGKEPLVMDSPMPTHKDAVSLVLEKLTDSKVGVIASLGEIGAVGHRILHAGDKITHSVIIDDEAYKIIESCNDFAPLHIPGNLTGIRACKELMPGVPMVGVFDTAFHQTMPEKAFMYAIPYEYYTKHAVRRYGAHGTSHSYVSKEAARFLGADINNLKTIVCHLGNGSSLSAVLNGKCVDTSMGLTPLQGVIMGTRSGDIDPAVLEFVCHKENLTIEEMLTILNKKSGVLALSGVSSDFRDIETAANSGNKRARLALDAFVYSVVKYIGAYAAAMNGVDVIAFTAGIGENSGTIRRDICSYLGYLGVKLKDNTENIRGEETVLSADDSKVKVLLVPTNEELAIARETVEIVSKSK